MNRLIYRAAIGALYHSRMHRLFAAYRGVGAILMFHRVLPAAPAEKFAPNASLSVTPEFFDAVIRFLLARGYEIVTMSEARRRLIDDGRLARPFICLSFDDGYRDNFEIALPICRGHGVPMTINITTGLIDGEIDPWWLVFEAALRHTDAVNFSFEGEAFSLRTISGAEKTAAFARLANAVHKKPPSVQHRFVAAMAESVGFDLRAVHARLAMRWDEIKLLAQDPLAELGAHTVNHTALKCQDEVSARWEMEVGRARLEERIGKRVEHFAYPFGGGAEAGDRDIVIARDLGFATAVTTRHSLLHVDHRYHLTALPRLSVNGHYQSLAVIEVFLSGATAALANRFRRLVTV